MTPPRAGSAPPATVLYGHRESGHAYKVALALTCLGIVFQFRVVDPASDRADRPVDWAAASRFGEIPVLIWRGEPLVQSNAILLKLAQDLGALGWDVDPQRLTEWLFWEANRIGFSLPNLRHALHRPGSQSPVTMAWLRGRLEADIGQLDQVFIRQPFLLGEQLSAADRACCGYLFYADQIDLDLAAWPGVLGWLERIRSIPGWAHPYVLQADSVA